MITFTKITISNQIVIYTVISVNDDVYDVSACVVGGVW